MKVRVRDMGVVDFKVDFRISNEHRLVLREYCKSLGGDPVKLANQLGLKVYLADLYNGEKGYIEFDESCGSVSKYKIVVNSKLPLEQQKFTIAHEIGHFVLHRNSEHFRKREREGAEVLSFPSGHRSTDHWDHSDYPQLFEREADAFAATILLPLHLLKSTSEFQNGKPIALARRLQLSPTVVLIRFEEAQFTN